MEKHGLVAAFFDGVVKRAMNAGLTRDEHFSVDGTLIESHASIKRFVPKDGSDDPPSGGGRAGDTGGFKPRNAEVNFHGHKRSNATHASRTDPEARLFKKGDGQAARLYHTGHAISENRHGRVMAVCVTESAGHAEPGAALLRVDAMRRSHGTRPRTLGSDKGDDRGPYLAALEDRGVVPHTAMRSGEVGGTCRPSRWNRQRRESVVVRRRMRRRQSEPGYSISQRCRKKIEEAFGWIKTVAGLYRTKLIGRWKIAQQMHLAAAAYNLVRMRKLTA